MNDVEVRLTQAVLVELPVTTSPPAGALYKLPPLVSWNATVSVCVLESVFEASVSASAAVTVPVVVVGAKFEFDAEIVVAPVVVVPVCTVKLTANAPAGIVTVAGTVAMLVLLLARLITTPPAPAAFGAICTW